MRICFILESHDPPRPNKIILEAASLLENQGIRVTMVYPEQDLWCLNNIKLEADLYFLKSDTELALSLAHSIERLGARVINSYDACRKLKDKTVTGSIMHQVDIPTPTSYATGNALQLISILDQRPLIIKPNRGYHGVGIRVVKNFTELCTIQDYSGMAFVQHYLSTARLDLKLFGIGDKVFTVRKPFSLDSYKKSGVPDLLTPRHEEIARKCAETFGLTLYGIDIAEIEESSYVIDLNYFPGYRGVPDAAHLLSEYMRNEVKALR